MEEKKNSRPTILFIFGGSGDLTNRKLIPALYNLSLDNYLPEKFSVIGIGRTSFTADDAYRKKLLEGVKQFSRRKDELDGEWKKFASNISYHELDLNSNSCYQKIAEWINEKEKDWGVSPIVIFYMAVAPQLAPVIAKKLSEKKLCENPKCTRLVFEKPFGHDLQSAKELNQLLRGMFEEEQIFRIDHYLGKETVQNILAFRFANALFEPIWNNNYIDHVQVTAAETVGVEDRGGYYEQSGALRDMVQNHILQLLCMIAMEPPVSFDANEIRNKKVDVLHALRKLNPEDVHANAVRGQYSSGWMNGKKMNDYRQEKNVNPQSPVETFVAAKFFIDNWRWRNVPFYIRTGKALHEKTTLITIQFKEAPNYSFPAEAAETWRPNRLTISIQPEMDIRIRFQAKRPGQDMILNPVDMVFSYAEAYEGKEPEAYETLLEDVISGNQTLFMRADQVEAAWKVITPILEVWQKRPPVDFPNYAPDSWGPEDSEELIAKDSHHWVSLPAKNKEE
ncbi:MAG TPA: glucose-6-phosphate dehydrogenase [Chitinophagaceae bacterium]|nr:glucose-6-phosphate dehydrogenase [Chitinophagaceae bacterium]